MLEFSPTVLSMLSPYLSENTASNEIWFCVIYEFTDHRSLTSCLSPLATASCMMASARQVVDSVRVETRRALQLWIVNIASTLARSAQIHKTYTVWVLQYTLHTHIHTHPFNGALSGITWVSRYQRGKTNLDFTEARDSEWQWHQVGHMQVCTSLQTDDHASTPPLSFYRPDALPATQPTASKH